MNLFKQHAGQNEKAAKAIIIEAIKEASSKYVIVQQEINTLLAAGTDEKLLSKVMKATRSMTRYQGQITESCKLYQELFGMQVNLEKIAYWAFKKHYPLLTKLKDAQIKAEEEEFGPQNGEHDAVKESIIESLVASGIPRDAIKILGGRIAKDLMKTVNPADFDCPEDYFDYLRAQSDLAAKNEGKTGEQIITENIMRNTEASVESAKERVKASPKAKTVVETEKKPKTDA